MTEFWSQNAYAVVITDDGSPSLRSLKASVPEDMHHSGGAWSETLYIYGTALAIARQLLKEPLHVASVGLGLGYNEILTAELIPNLSTLISFETEEFLIDNFQSWIQGKLSGDACLVMSLIETSVQKKFPNSAAVSTLREWQKQGQWRILKEGLGPSQLVLVPKNLNVILYDAFSSRTSPELWDEEFLFQFFSQVVAGDAVFSTYACVGSLKRALLKAGFCIVERKGFHGKRSSTFAVRMSSEGITELELQEYLRTCEYTR